MYSRQRSEIFRFPLAYFGIFSRIAFNNEEIRFIRLRVNNKFSDADLH